MNKNVVTGVGYLLLFMYIPIATAQTIILYRFLHVPDVLWVLFFINLPISFATTILGQVLKNSVDK